MSPDIPAPSPGGQAAAKKGLANAWNQARLGIMGTDDNEGLSPGKSRRIEKLFSQSREETTKGLAGLSILASGAIIVSINLLVVLYDISGGLQYVCLLVGSWICLLGTSVCVIWFRLANGKWLLEHSQYIFYSRKEIASDGEKHDRKERAAILDRRESLLIGVIHTSFFLGLALLLVFATINLVTSGSGRVEKPTPTTTPTTMPTSMPI